MSESSYSCCRIYTLLASDCPCLLKLQTGSQVIAINLSGATVRPIPSGFHIQGIGCGAKVATASGFTAADIEDLICACESAAETGPTVADMTCSISDESTTTTIATDFISATIICLTGSILIGFNGGTSAVLAAGQTMDFPSVSLGHLYPQLDLTINPAATYRVFECRNT